MSRPPIHGLDVDQVRRYVAALEDPSLPEAGMQWTSRHSARIAADLRKDQLLSVQINYHPGWHAEVNGLPRRVGGDKIGLMWVEPQCEGRCTVELVYDGGTEMQAAKAAIGSVISQEAARQTDKPTIVAFLGADPRPIQDAGLIATIKHYAENNQENNRQGVNVNVDEKTLHEIDDPALAEHVRRDGEQQHVDTGDAQMLVEQVGVVRMPERHPGRGEEETAAVAALGVALMLLVTGDRRRDGDVADLQRLIVDADVQTILRQAQRAQLPRGALCPDEGRRGARDPPPPLPDRVRVRRAHDRVDRRCASSLSSLRSRGPVL